MGLWLLLCLVRTVLAVEKVLMDTRLETEELNWLVSPESGWEEVVAVDKHFNTMRTYRVCNVDTPNQDNWLRSGYIRRRGARLVYVELRFTVRDCNSLVGTGATGGHCRETFALHHRQSDSDEESARTPAQLKAAYGEAQEIGAQHIFSLGNRGTVNRATLRIGPLDAAGFRLAFRDRGACVNLLSVRAYHKKCPAIILGLARYPEMPTGPTLASLVVASGTCVAHAEEAAVPLKLHCTSEGDWVVLIGECRCQPGYRGNQELTACTEIEDHVTFSKVPRTESERGPSQNASAVPPPCSQWEEQAALLRANRQLLEEQAEALAHMTRTAQALNSTLNAILRRLPALPRDPPHPLTDDDLLLPTGRDPGD
uniref:ephrin type-B receptor 1-like n=1 Tax=Pristiophorus japonicus TaxID=55135 RepID=UPI00398F4857